LLVIFRDMPHHLSVMAQGDCPACSFSVMGKPLLLYNIAKIASRKSIDGILLPEGFSQAVSAISASYPSMRVDEYKDRAFIPATGDLLELPLNSIIVESAMGDLVADQIVYPWDLLRIMGMVLESEIKTSSISSNATVCESSIVSGPCVIEDGAFVDDFCKIKGPAYIGRNSRVGTGSLLRNCVVGSESSIGFNCEVARSYLAGKNRVAHHNVILDSIVGEGTWMGGYVGTTNVLLNRKNVKYKVGDQLVDTGLQNFGAVIGAGCTIGAGVIILPGRYIPSNSTIQAGTVVSK
jgi:UDP-N-acetylglucosamine diphosphorylase / glucose-1-phosphate thymidylyltransferase / UDP-N-acetylgalactosamine diphosphorylase / glucosamine-1-phosphate N-acetyltransferase / galactosamine-1-phosphate N-acetyltransferase